MIFAKLFLALLLLIGRSAELALSTDVEVGSASSDVFYSGSVGETIGENTFSVDLAGYGTNCSDGGVFYREEAGVWKEVSSQLPGKGMYYLEDEFLGYGACDYVRCEKLKTPHTVSLIEYKEVGTKASPEDGGINGESVSVYKAVPLTGKLKIDVYYYGDENCTEAKTFSTVIEK